MWYATCELENRKINRKFIFKVNGHRWLNVVLALGTGHIARRSKEKRNGLEAKINGSSGRGVAVLQQGGDGDQPDLVERLQRLVFAEVSLASDGMVEPHYICLQLVKITEFPKCASAREGDHNEAYTQ